MTTNNHPAHGPVSLERLHQISEILSKAAAQSDGGNLGYAMADAVKVIDEVLELRRNYLALRGEIEDVQAQLYEAENRNEVDATELQERRKAEMGNEPVRYLNKFSGACVTLEQQPNAADDAAVYVPLYAAPQPVPVVPDGYVIVPIVPTEDMIIDGFESVPDPHFSDEKEWEEYEALSGCRQAARRAELCWAAMIKAAPKQENI
ncbi:DUF550 domain-containing protein [Citrobacter sp. Cf140]|uniref:DUF550 domain-containing protein n=1 Tax=Citrobacter sp. Cf140 TaxID=2985083 RepID=UPI0025755234|nr:DUF550 domain-containing protein [Citrobacter sp. Cf140]MDM3097191.1 DUF550 domain-containing protein [Citrobacter sp. Cf140]